MKSQLNQEISIIGVPLDMGGRRLGTRLGPEAIRITGLIERLKNLGYAIEDLGNIDISNEYQLKKSKSNLNHLDIVKKSNDKLCQIVDSIVKRKRLPLVLGGDHSTAFGTVKGLLKNFENLGVIYFDAHADINTAKTSPTGNIHGMPIAGLMGLGSEKLSSIACSERRLKPEHIVYIGLRDVDLGEREVIRRLGIKAFSMQDIDSLGIEKVMEKAIKYISKSTDAIHISFDVDCLDPELAPGTGVKVLGGLNFREARIALEMISQMDKVSSVECVEVNPLLDHQNETAEVAAALLLVLFGEAKL